MDKPNTPQLTIDREFRDLIDVYKRQVLPICCYQYRAVSFINQIQHGFQILLNLLSGDSEQFAYSEQFFQFVVCHNAASSP